MSIFSFSTRKKSPASNNKTKKVSQIIKISEPENSAFIIGGLGCSSGIEKYTKETYINMLLRDINCEKEKKNNTIRCKYDTLSYSYGTTFKNNNSMTYKDIFYKCYEKKEKSIFGNSTIITIADRIINPFNFPHKNFSKEIRDSLSRDSQYSKGPIVIEGKLLSQGSHKGKKSRSFLLEENLSQKSEKNKSALPIVIEGTLVYDIKETESLLNKVLKRLYARKNVYIFGFSYGGLIVNRLCQELQNVLNNRENDKSIIEKEILDNHFKAMTLNSIFLANAESVKDISIVNYMEIHDIALRLNYLQSFTTFSIPDIKKIENNTEQLYIRDDPFLLYTDTKNKIVWYATAMKKYTDKVEASRYSNNSYNTFKHHSEHISLFMNQFLGTGKNYPFDWRDN